MQFPNICYDDFKHVGSCWALKKKNIQIVSMLWNLPQLQKVVNNRQENLQVGEESLKWRGEVSDTMLNKREDSVCTSVLTSVLRDEDLTVG